MLLTFVLWCDIIISEQRYVFYKTGGFYVRI
nr:MAG TPA: hypothetical protein [Caudoviricetes sp.]